MGKTILGLLLGFSLCFGSIQEVIAASQARITGAFGLNLYDKLDPNIVENKIVTDEFFFSGKEYIKKLELTIKKNLLSDFENAKLLSTGLRKEIKL